MPSLTWYAQSRVLDALMRSQPLVVPSTWYIGLVTTAGPDNFLAGVEVQGGSYARVAIPASLVAWAGTQGQGSTGVSIGLGGHTSNNAAIRYPDPTANWGSIIGWEAWDAPANGIRWMYDILQVPKTISIGESAEMFPAGELQISFV